MFILCPCLKSSQSCDAEQRWCVQYDQFGYFQKEKKNKPKKIK